MGLKDLTGDDRCAELYIKISNGTEFALQCSQNQ